MGVVAAFSAVSFAQTNVTDKLLNPDAEKGMLGWDVTFVDGGQVWNKQTKGQEKAVGYHGYFNWAFENWRNSAAGLTDGSIFQVVNDLPDGTYVFGAYATATRDAWTPSIDDIKGVSIFANEYSMPVATHRVEGMNEKWAHAIKFNVAATVTGGTLKVGMKTESTTASFVTMDNATLYYFGDMSKEEALLEMAKIDIAASVDSVSVFLTAGKMNVDTLAFLQSAIEATQGVTVENAAQLDEDLYWGKRQAKKSIAAYAELAAAIESGKEIAAKEWSDVEETIIALETLKELIAACEEKYNEGSALDAEATAWAANLNEAGALVELDSCYLKAEEYSAAIDTLTLGEEIGQYLYSDYEKAQAYYDEIMIILADAGTGDLSSMAVKSQCEILFGRIQQIIDNPIDYAEFPIIIPRSNDILPGQTAEYKVLEGAYVASYNGRDNVPSYKSKLYRFREPLTKVRFIVRENAGNDCGLLGDKPVTCWGTFKMFDEDGMQIPLTEDMIRSNADHNALCPSPDGVGIPGLLDDNVATYFHTAWNYAVPEHHYIEVTLPEGEYSAFSFFFTSIRNSTTKNFPAVMEITYVSELVTELQQAVLDATQFNPLPGTAPGFYNIDVTPFKTAIAEAQALLEEKAPSDSEIEAAIANIKNEQAKIQAKGMMMPEAGKKYRIVSGEDGFMPSQNVQKALTIRNEEDYGQVLWWETASADSAQQEFTLEAMTELGEGYYAFKNVKYDLYLGEYFVDGNRVNNKFVLTDKKTAFYLKHLGYGQFAIIREGHDREWFHALNHNQGAIQGTGEKGVASQIITWVGGYNDPSSWEFRELQTLPFNAKSISEVKFYSESISLYEGVNTLVLKADKECEFQDLVITDLLGEAISVESMTISGQTATLVLAESIGDFVFSFNNAEGIEEVTVDGSFTYRGVSATYTALENLYNTVLAIAPVEGPNVGQVSDLSEYHAALKHANDLLTNGAEDAELEAAIVALEAVQANLTYNLPKADTDYLILLGLDAIKGNHLTDMAVFADTDQDFLRWTYVSLTNAAFRWRFIDCGETMHGQNAYYIQSAATGQYVTRTMESSANVFLVDGITSVRPFCIYFLTNGKVALADSYWENGSQSLHPNGHGNGAAGNKGNKMITWGKNDVASAMRIVEAEQYITDVIYSINDIEEIEAAEQVAPAVKGIYDLFGRRIEVPATTGIYIVDGKKQVIKK